MWTKNVRRMALLVALVAAAGMACQDEATTVTGGSDDPNTPKGDGAMAGAAAPQKDGELTKLADAERLRYSMTDFAHFADRSRDGHLVVDLGTLSSRKYTNGGWRSGWNVTPRKDGDTTYFEADAKSARIFFKSEGDVAKVIVRMKAVKSSNKVVFYLNDKAISNTTIDGEWKDYPVEVAPGMARKGENQFMMRFTHDTKLGGRTQVALVDRVDFLPKGSKVSDGPKGPRTFNLTLAAKARKVLPAASPQSYTFRVLVPKTKGVKFGVALGAKKAGAKMVITAVSDHVKKATLVDETIDDAKAGKWQEKVVDLTPFAGHITEFEFKASGEFGPGQMAGFGEPGIYSPEVQDGATEPKAKGTPAKNVIVYLVDTLRRDKLRAFNPKARPDTPNFEAFAKEGTAFDAAYDAENWTKPSCATVLTGLFPETHKAKEDSSKLPQKVTMMSEHLQKQKFRTASFIANGYVSDAFGFKQGWDKYVNYIREKKVTDAGRLVKDTLAWIDKNSDERFYIYVQTIDPHVPYSAPGKWKFKYYSDDYHGPIKPQATGDQMGAIKTHKMEVDATDKRYIESLYDGEVAYNDSEFGNLVAGLKERGLYDNTLIVILTDHGEEFWEHGSVGHGHSLYDELLHAPMLMRYPNQVAAGRRVPEVVSTVDLVPTVLDILGVEPIKEVEGVSFKDTLDGLGNPRPRIAQSDFLYRKKSFRAGPYTWITIGRGGSLFNIDTDPHQKKDVILKDWIARAYLRSQMGMFKGSPDVTRWWEGGEVAAKKVNIEADKVEMNPELQEQLEAMGYVQGAKGELSAEQDKKKMEEEDKK